MDLSNPFNIVAFLKEHRGSGRIGIYFPYTADEDQLIDKIDSRTYSGESTNVHELHELRVLYWQVIGWLRK